MTNPEDLHRPELVRAKARVVFMEQVWKWFLACVVAAILVISIVDTLQGREVREELVSCNTEGGACYERGQERLQGAIRAIYEDGVDREQITRRIIVLAAACAGDESNRTIDSITDCVNERLLDENRVEVGGNR